MNSDYPVYDGFHVEKHRNAHTLLHHIYLPSQIFIEIFIRDQLKKIKNEPKKNPISCALNNDCTFFTLGKAIYLCGIVQCARKWRHMIAITTSPAMISILVVVYVGIWCFLRRFMYYLVPEADLERY